MDTDGLMLSEGFYTILANEDLPTGEFRSVVLLNPDHDIYKAHFPGYPITPGVCLLKVAVELLGNRFPGASLSRADNVKFTSTLIPDSSEEIEFLFKHKKDNLWSVSVRGRELYSKMVIGVNFPHRSSKAL